jgi:lysozyme
MLERDLQEWEEYDARLSDDSPVALRTLAAQRSGDEFRQTSDETPSALESPFLLGNAGEMEAETEGMAGERAGRRSAHRAPRFRTPGSRTPKFRTPGFRTGYAGPAPGGDCDCGDPDSDPDSADTGEYGESEGLEALETEALESEELETEALYGADSQESLVAESSEVDPYAAIRPALSREHANLPAEEVTLRLGHLPASLVLHQLLNSPQMRQATVASILGRGARRSVRLNGLDVSIPVYLRMVSRLCGEVAEQSETPKKKASAVVAHPAAAATPPAAAATPPAAVAALPLGVDLYSGNNTNAAGFTNLKSHGRTFAIAKTSQGTRVDTSFVNYYGGIRDSGMIRGSYHFLSNKRSTSAVYGGTIERQANTVLSVVTRLAPGDLAPALDLEDEPRSPVTGRALDAAKGGRFPLDQGLQPTEQGYHYRRGHYPNWQVGRDELLADIQDFLDRIETALGRTPIIYTSRMWGDTDMMNDPHTMSQYPLWIVWHVGILPDLALGGWGHDWDIVQYAEQGGNWRGLNPYTEPDINIPGIDLDAYHWTTYGLRGLADIGRPSIAFSGHSSYIAESDVGDVLHLLTGTPWTDRNLTQLPSQPDLTGSDPVLLTSSTALFLYYRKGNHLIEATATQAAMESWHTAQIEDTQAPIHDPRAIMNGSKRHVVYWGADDDWHLLTWDGTWTRSGGILSAAGIKTSATHGQSTGQPMLYVTGGVVHIVGRIGAEGHLYDVWFEGNAWRRDDLTALGRSVIPTLPAATYSSCAHETSNGVGVVFRAVGGNLWVIDRTGNTPTNLTAAARATLAAGHPTCFVLNNEPHVVYRGSDKLIYDISLHGGVWRVQQVCAAKAAADPVATSAGGMGMVAMRAMNGVIHFARFDGTAWTCSATQ